MPTEKPKNLLSHEAGPEPFTPFASEMLTPSEIESLKLDLRDTVELARERFAKLPKRVARGISFHIGDSTGPCGVLVEASLGINRQKLLMEGWVYHLWASRHAQLI